MLILKYYLPFRHFPVLFKCRYGRKCCKCERVSKYKCLACFAQKFRDDHGSYREEEKLIEKCDNCDGNQEVIKRKSENKRKKDFLLKKQIGEHPKTQQKPTDSNRMVTVDTVEKSWKNSVFKIRRK